MNAAVAQQSVVYRWQCDKFTAKRQLPNGGRVHSPEWLAFDCCWRLLCFTDGNPLQRREGSGSLSVYLEVADQAALPSDWLRHVNFKIRVINCDAARNRELESEHTFNSNFSDYGFPQMATLERITEPDSGYLVDDTLVVEAEIFVRRCVHPSVHPTLQSALVAIL